MWLWRREKQRLFTLLENIMATEQDLQNDLDAIRDGVTTALTALNATIADLKAQIAAGSPVTQEQLDALDAEAKTIIAGLAPPTP